MCGIPENLIPSTWGPSEGANEKVRVHRSSWFYSSLLTMPCIYPPSKYLLGCCRSSEPLLVVGVHVMQKRRSIDNYSKLV